MIDSVLAHVLLKLDESGHIGKASVTPKTRFVDDLGMDSLDQIEFIMQMEDDFEISMPDDNVLIENNVGEFIALIERTKRGTAV